jgi:hypothetical protein
MWIETGQYTAKLALWTCRLIQKSSSALVVLLVWQDCNGSGSREEGIGLLCVGVVPSDRNCFQQRRSLLEFYVKRGARKF